MAWRQIFQTEDKKSIGNRAVVMASKCSFLTSQIQKSLCTLFMHQMHQMSHLTIKVYRKLVNEPKNSCLVCL